VMRKRKPGWDKTDSLKKIIHYLPGSDYCWIMSHGHANQ
jgi:hypothetical protein